LEETIHHLSVLQISLRTRQNKSKQIKEVIINLTPVCEQWREKMLAEGRQEGRQEERQELVRKMLQEGASIEFITKVTGYTRKQIQKLQNI
jgi:predicted transposase/invertase (TIGR01784 family)